MNIWMIKLALVLTTTSLCAGALESGSPDQILHLTHSNFTEAVQAYKMLLVNFYAPWCGYCKTLSTELTKVATDLPNLNIDGRVAIVDASVAENSDLCVTEGVNGFPTVVLYRHGERYSDYLGDRSRNAILDYLKKRMGPPAIPISSVRELEDFLESLKVNTDLDVQSIVIKNRLHHERAGGLSTPVAGVGQTNTASTGSDSRTGFHQIDNHVAVALALFLPNTPDSGLGVYGKACKLYFSLASVYDQVRFLYADNRELLSYFKVKENSLFVFSDRSHDDIDPLTPVLVRPLTEDLNEADIMTDISAYSIPLLVPYSVQSQPFVHSIPVKKHVLVFHDSHERSSKTLQVLEGISASVRGRLVFVTIPSTEHQLMQYFGLDISSLPELVIADMTDEANMRRYNYKDFLLLKSISPKHRLQEGHLRTFIEEYLSGKLVRSLFSDSVEEAGKANKLTAGQFGTENAGLLRTIVGSQFVEHLHDPESQDTHILLYIFAPWCAHCKSFEPVLRGLALHFHHANAPGSTKLKLLKIDGSRNEIDHDKVRVRGYPTLYLFRARHRDNPIEYDEERTLERLIRFVDSANSNADASSTTLGHEEL